jgi:hypothetical protein
MRLKPSEIGLSVRMPRVNWAIVIIMIITIIIITTSLAATMVRWCTKTLLR